MDNQELAIRNDQDILALPNTEQFKKDMTAINQFQKAVHELMIPDQDYGVIPGTSKPTLLKPGAEKITKIMGLSDRYEILEKLEDWDKPLFRYLIKCTLASLKNGVVISEGMGECNSYESKYRYRDAQRKCPACGAEAIIKGKEEYGGGWLCFKKKGGCGATFADTDPLIIDQSVGKVDNEDIFSLVNTILKMAEKRALVDAALHAGRLSNVFTQDIEDMPQIAVSKPIETKATVKPETQQKQQDVPVCPIHGTAMKYYEKGDRHWYSHKIEGTDDWCNGETQKPGKASKAATEKLPEVKTDDLFPA